MYYTRPHSEHKEEQYQGLPLLSQTSEIAKNTIH